MIRNIVKAHAHILIHKQQLIKKQNYVWLHQ